MPVSPPRSAYLHVPFCAHRCGYCNFTVVAGREDLSTVYLDAIERELAGLGGPCPVDTLYVGGGTPTRLSPPLLGRLLQSAREWFPPAPGYEWTVEANPADVGGELLDMLAAAGVTRLSLGGQSFHADKLAVLERDHSAEQIGDAIEACHERGLRASLDLIFAAPGETLDQWETDLRRAVSLDVGHISTYGLTFDKGSAFWSRRESGALLEVDEDLQREMYLAAIDRLGAADFEHYEVSNFARPGRRSRHNEAYWSGRGYYAAGPGAARYVNGVRETNHQSTTTYLKRVLAGESPVAFREELSPEMRAREQLVFGLRRLEGIDLLAFAGATGHAVQDLAGPQIDWLCGLGLLEQVEGRLRLTREGLLVSDAIWPDLL
ncbi:Oxygen-independent coproporphyrinogen-III oxidase-like protein [Posidoniimonas polymericola]|uniref:Heme chaperone HemW n=1 Tax=Posidoniimonas polymericola TaxID=2528002 RepID=A0A5C5YQ82_9BACT|nr:radical SAM family heme chaperone HemW [Posidoniimonas polymericola]TWT77122.1 Oxygen-independent coproporphyrinogen-III oxidase-like protein [Posidoniimonas polymericola]